MTKITFTPTHQMHFFPLPKTLLKSVAFEQNPKDKNNPIISFGDEKTMRDFFDYQIKSNMAQNLTTAALDIREEYALFLTNLRATKDFANPENKLEY